MKLDFKETLLTVMSATAVVTSFLFAVDVLQQVNSVQDTAPPTVASLALMMGLISMTCVVAGALSMCLHLAWKTCVKAPNLSTALTKTAAAASGLAICALFTYFVLVELLPSRSLHYLLVGFVVSGLALVGLLQISPFRFAGGLWYRVCSRRPIFILTILIGCAVFASVESTPLLEGYPWILRCLQMVMLTGLIGATWFFLSDRLDLSEKSILSLVCVLQFGTIGGVLSYQAPANDLIVTLERNSSAAHQSLAILRWFYDEDGDGFSSYYGGGDCDDENPNINPHAPEIPGNGIDDNCIGGDGMVVNQTIVADVATTPETSKKKNTSIVLIVADTLRADRVLYGAQSRDTAPNLSKWSRSSTRFLRTYAQAPHTPRSLPSLLSGRYPSRIRWVNSFENYPVPHQTERFVTQDLSDAGYATVSITSHWYFSRVPTVLRGFDRNRVLVESYRQQTDAAETTDVSLAELEQLRSSDTPFFLLVHYIDPHEPYRVRGEEPVFGERRMVDRYDGEVHYFDSHVSRLLDEIKRIQQTRDVAVIVTSDHGESFREHGLLYHGRTLYNEEIHVPLLIQAPGFKPATIPHPVGLVDLAETIRAFANIENRPSDGEALQAMMREPESQRFAAIFSELLPYPRYNQHRMAAISRDGRWKLIRNLTRNTIELFELSRDPMEKQNVFSRSSPALVDLKLDLEHFVDGRPPRTRTNVSIDESNHQPPFRLREATKSGRNRSNL